MDGEVVPTESPVPSREFVLDFEQSLKEFGEQSGAMLDAESLTHHHFAPGIYMRELHIPAGTCLTGKIHLHEHMSIISAGCISVLTEHGVGIIEAPCTLRSHAGIKRVGFALTDTVWTCIHPNPDDCTDLVELERRHIAPSFESLPATKPDLLEVT